MFCLYFYVGDKMIRPLLENDGELKQSGCEGKYYYHTYDFAKEQAARYRIKFNRHNQRAYKCDFCPYYHIGSMDKLIKELKVKKV